MPPSQENGKESLAPCLPRYYYYYYYDDDDDDYYYYYYY